MSLLEQKTTNQPTNSQQTIKRIATGVAVVVGAGILALNSFYMLDSKEQALVMRFGEYLTTNSKPGINFKLPFIDEVEVVNVSSVYRLELGFRTLSEGSSGNPAYSETYEEEALMVTGDENLALVETVVQYQITSLKDHLLNVDSPTYTLKTIADSVVHRVIASHTLDEALTDNKLQIQDEIRQDLQALVDEYGLGVTIRDVQLQDVAPPAEVKEAFNDVTKAKEDKIASINKATGYSNQTLTQAKGNAESIKNEAEAYYQERVKEAEGNVSEFKQVYKQYVNGPKVTRTRLYYEVMQDVLPNIKKVITSQNGEMIQWLPLGDTQTQTNVATKEE